MHPFRFGVINEMTMPASDWLDHVRRVEALGCNTFLIRDHFVPDFFGDQLAPLPALMAAAAATTTLRVGTLVLDNDYRHPVMLAKEAATLDQLVGAGRGLQDETMKGGHAAEQREQTHSTCPPGRAAGSGGAAVRCST